MVSVSFPIAKMDDSEFDQVVQGRDRSEKVVEAEFVRLKDGCCETNEGGETFGCSANAQLQKARCSRGVALLILRVPKS